MFAHMEWADAAVWNAVLSAPELRADPALRDSLFHTHLTQHAFLQLWLGRDVERVDPDTFQFPTGFMAWAAENHRGMREFVDSLDDAALSEPLIVPWSRIFARRLGSLASPTTLWDTLVQVPAHTLYHRGQTNRRIRELEGEPPLVDFIVWKWLARPTASW
jgi:uncharacterized damage-inducible protein DinB